MDFVCFSVNNWEERRARKQQFMLHLSLRSDVGRVLYIEPALNIFRSLFFFWREAGTSEGRDRRARAWVGRIDPVPDSPRLFVYTPLSFFPWSFRFPVLYTWNLWLIHFFLKRRLRRLNLGGTVLWLYHPFDVPLLDWFKPRIASCFDWAEKWSEYFLEYQGARQKVIAALEESIIRRSDFIFVTSQRLLGLARSINPRAQLLRDGTVPEIFSSFNGSVPEDLKNVPRPIIGYVGTVNDRIDRTLVKTLSLEMSSCSFVFVGNVLADRVDVASLLSLKNVYFLGGKPYTSLPGYIMNFDVCILPYVLDPRIAAATKVYDYLAAGKPIVAPALPELEYLRECVVLARMREEFVAAVQKSLEGLCPEVSARHRQVAGENSWATRAAEIMRFLS